MIQNDKSEIVLGFALDIAKAVIKAKEDGDLDLEDAALFIPLLSKIAPAIQALSGLGEELKSFSMEDVLSLAQFAIEKLGDAVSEKLGRIIKQALVAAVEAAKLVQEIRA
jgi:hypothetical protein